MQNKILIKNETELCRIEIEGIIGIPEEWQFEHPDQRIATYEGFREALQRIASIDRQQVVVEIRSTGGDVNDALLIYEALKATGAHVTTRCYGYTASAATIIAQAASEGCREIAPGALYLIHNSICATEGNAEELKVQTELLEKTDERLAALYAERSGRAAEEFRALMAENAGRGRWLSPEEAIAAGLVDSLIAHSAEQEATSEEGAAEPSKRGLAQNLAHGWQRLLTALRGEADEESGNPSKTSQHSTPQDRNVLHWGQELQRGVTGAELWRGQQSAEATQVAPHEEPSLRERLRSANAEAYAADVRGFQK